MTRLDALLTAVCVFCVSVLAYSFGLQHGKQRAALECMKQDGRVVAYSVQDGDKLQCIYIKNRRGLT